MDAHDDRRAAVMREDRLDDGTEDFDECCDGTESCDCDECDALEEPEYCERICRLSPEGSSTVVELCRLCGAYLDDDLTIDPGICAECSEEVDDADLGFALPDEFDDDDGQHDFSEEDVVT